MNPTHFGAIGESSTPTEALSGGSEYNLLREVAKFRKFGPTYRGFNQGAEERFHYACVIVSWMRSFYTLFNIQDDFRENMLEACDYCEKEGVWNPKAGGYVLDIGKALQRFFASKYPERKVTIHKVKYGSSLMGTAIARNIPVITANFWSNEYGLAKADGTITEDEISGIQKGKWGHCFCVTGLGYFWSYLEFQDNYEGRPGNTYKTWFFRRLLDVTWQKECFYIMLPENLKMYQK